MSRPLRALITGGAGFLGSHLCNRLLSEGFEVICLDNLIHALGLARATSASFILASSSEVCGDPQIFNAYLAREILAVTRSPSSIGFHPLPADDPKVRCPDSSMAKGLLGWYPKMFRHEGLE